VAALLFVARDAKRSIVITDLDGVTYRIRIVGAQLAGWVDDTRNQLAIDAAVHHVTTADPCQQGNNMSFTSDNMTKSAFSMLDMMMNMQRLGLQTVSAYQPFISAFLDSTSAAERVTRPRFDATRGRLSGLRELHDTNEEQVIGVGEEVLNIGTRMVPGKTTRIRRVVVQTPVQQDVTLHTETVVLERRKPISGPGNEVLTEVTIEMSDFNEVPVVSKVVHLVEEVLLRKEVTARTETIHDTVRRDKLEIEQPSNLPVVVKAAAQQEEKRREESSPADLQDKKQLANPPQTGGKTEQKRP
jgi:stress response protein YsnF